MHCLQGNLLPLCTALLYSNIVALPTRVFDSLIYYPFVFSKTSCCHFLIDALPTRIFDYNMYCPFVCVKGSLLWKVFDTLLTKIVPHKKSYYLNLFSWWCEILYKWNSDNRCSWIISPLSILVTLLDHKEWSWKKGKMKVQRIFSNSR